MSISFNEAIFNAAYTWVCESGFRPYLEVNADLPGVKVPLEYSDVAANGTRHITLNIDPTAVGSFHVTDFGLTFLSRFNKISRQIDLPWGAFMLVSPDCKDVLMMFYPAAESAPAEPPVEPAKPRWTPTIVGATEE